MRDVHVHYRTADWRGDWAIFLMAGLYCVLSIAMSVSVLKENVWTVYTLTYTHSCAEEVHAQSEIAS